MQTSSIRTIAKSLDLSVATISKVINGTGSISEETKERVLQEMRRVKYLPNRVARELKKGNKVIGVFSQGTNMEELGMLSVAEKLRGISNVANEAGYDIMLFFVDYEDFQHESKIWSIIEKYTLSGVISLKPIRQSVQRKLIEYQIPHISVNWQAALVKETQVVATNIHMVLEKAVSHFYERGKRNIAFMHWISNVYIIDVKKWSDALEKKYKGLKIETIYCSKAQTFETLESIFKTCDYDAFLFFNKKHGFWYMDYARQNNIKIPEDVALMFYDYQDYCGLISPKITGIRQPLYEIGKVGCKNLISLIEGNEEKISNQFLEPIFIQGETT